MWLLTKTLIPVSLKVSPLKILKRQWFIQLIKKNARLKKSNLRPISIFPNLSEIYERLLYDQIYIYFDKSFVKNQYVFRKGYNAQYWLLAMVEKMKAVHDRNMHCSPQQTLLKRLIVLNMIFLLPNYMRLFLITNLLESCTHISIIRSWTIILVYLKGQYYVRYYLL